MTSGFVYLDTSVALARLLAEDIAPPSGLWERPLVSSRLLEYEMWTRIHARGLAESHGGGVRDVLGRVAMIELAAPLLRRAVEAFPIPVRTLDAVHLAALTFLIEQDQDVCLATYDRRMKAAAVALDVALYPLG